MQHRMKTHPLTMEQMEGLLSTAPTASLATLKRDGSPYVTPVHFVYHGGKAYIHGLPKGQKLDHIKADARVSMTVYRMDALLLDPDQKPCDTNTKYESVMMQGKAEVIDDPGLKQEILARIVQKYTPQLGDKALPDHMIKGTAVIQIDIHEMTGKFYE